VEAEPGGGVLDSTDMRLLKMLNTNARVSLSEMGREVGLSTSGVRRRMMHLEKTGVIKGYTAVIDPQKFDCRVLAFVNIEVGPRSISEISKALSRYREVCELHQTTGRHALLAKVRARGIDDLKRFVNERISSLDPIKSVQTTMVMGTIKETLLNP